MREGKVVRSRMDYLLGTDRSLFRNVSVRDPRHNTDHFMVVGCLRSAPEREHTRYIVGRRKLPLRPPTKPTREEGIFAALQRSMPKPHGRDRHKNEWISEETWRLFDKRVSARRRTGFHTRIWRLGRAIRVSLQGDRKRRVEIAGQEVETLLGEDPPNAKEAWRRLKGWYKAAFKQAPPPARATLERIMVERVNLYSYISSPGENILVTVAPAEIDDSVPTEDEIEAAVKKLRRNRSGGESGMQAEYLKGWLGYYYR